MAPTSIRAPLAGEVAQGPGLQTVANCWGDDLQRWEARATGEARGAGPARIASPRARGLHQVRAFHARVGTSLPTKKQG